MSETINFSIDNNDREEFLEKFEYTVVSKKDELSNKAVFKSERIDISELGLPVIAQLDEEIKIRHEENILGEETKKITLNGKHIYKNDDVDDIYKRDYRIDKKEEHLLKQKFERFYSLREKFDSSTEKGKIYLLKKGEMISGHGHDKKYHGLLTDDVIIYKKSNTNFYTIFGTLSLVEKTVKISYRTENCEDSKFAYLREGVEISKINGFDYKSRDVSNVFDMSSFRNLLAKR